MGAHREGTADTLLFWALIADVGLLAVAGGPPPDTLALPLFVLMAIGLTALLAVSRSGEERRPSAAVRALLVAVVALPALQLLPLPPRLWHELPGAGKRKAVLSLIGAHGSWQPLSLVPVETASAALLAFCFVVLVAAMIALRQRRFEQLLVALGAIALANITVGILQVASGGSPRFLAKADHGALLGFFANKNHIGVVIAAGLALFVCVVEQFDMLRARRRIWLAGATLLALICVVPTNSRAGLLLTLAVALWIGLRSVASGTWWMRAAVAAGGVALVAVLGLSPVADRVYRRFGDVDQDLRWRFIEQSQPLLHDYGLTGAGGGSFSRLFIANERLVWVKPTVVNELHNEYLQTLIEYGLPGALLLLATILLVIRAAVQAWRLPDRRAEARLRIEVGVVIVLLFIVHSSIDYPLRRPATWALFAAGCALILRPAPKYERDDVGESHVGN